MNKSILIIVIILFGITNYLTFTCTQINTESNTNLQFRRAAIKAGVAEYNDLLDFEFKSVQQITLDYLLKNQKNIVVPAPPTKKSGEYNL